MTEEAFNGSATDPNHPARISVTFLGYETWCDRCGLVGNVATQVEAQALAREHKKTHT